MENYPYSSHPGSGDSSPRSREIECENAVAAWDEQLPPSSARIKLMCSYGGRIQPRSHDNQLSYVGGDTKILAVDRSIRFPAIIAKLAALSGLDEVCLKYQLPGEDLDALISVTNNEDLEHMMIEYDCLHRSGSKPAPRLRIFLFPFNSSIGKNDRMLFVDAPSDQTQAAAMTTTASPDFLFGLDKGFVPPSAVKVKDLAPESGVLESFPVEAPPVKEDLQMGGEAVVSPAEMQRQMQELQRLQIAENQQQQVSNIQRNGSDEALTRVYHTDYYLPRVQEKTPPAPAPAPAQIPEGYWQDHQRSMATAGRYASVAGGDQQFFFIPAAPGVFPSAAAAGQGYYTAMQRVMPAEVYRDAASSAVYAVAQPPLAAQAQQSKAAYDNAVWAQGVDVSAGFAAPTQVAYDSAGRAVYYTGAAPTYQTVSGVAINSESKAVKPSQVS